MVDFVPSQRTFYGYLNLVDISIAGVDVPICL
jgi:hypothetical protein